MSFYDTASQTVPGSRLTARSGAAALALPCSVAGCRDQVVHVTRSSVGAAVLSQGLCARHQARAEELRGRTPADQGPRAMSNPRHDTRETAAGVGYDTASQTAVGSRLTAATGLISLREDCSMTGCTGTVVSVTRRAEGGTVRAYRLCARHQAELRHARAIAESHAR